MTTNSSANIRTGAAGTILQGQGIGTAPDFSTATYPSSTTENQLLYSSVANAVIGLSTTNSGVLITNAAGVPSLTTLATNGQVLIGATGGAPAAANIAAGTGIEVVNGPNTIGLNVTGGGYSWINATSTSQSVFSRSGYIANNSSLVTFSLGASNIGDAIKIIGFGTGGWKLVPMATQKIYFGSTSTTLGTGYLASTNAGDCVEIIALSNTQLIVTSSIGDITVA